LYPILYLFLPITFNKISSFLNAKDGLKCWFVLQKNWSAYKVWVKISKLLLSFEAKWKLLNELFLWNFRENRHFCWHLKVKQNKVVKLFLFCLLPNKRGLLYVLRTGLISQKIRIEIQCVSSKHTNSHSKSVFYASHSNRIEVSEQIENKS